MKRVRLTRACTVDFSQRDEGDVVEVEDSIAINLVRAGYAAPVGAEPESATVAAPESASVAPARRRRPRGR